MLQKRVSKPITVFKNKNSLKLPINTSMTKKESNFENSVNKTKSIIEQSNKEHILPAYRKTELVSSDSLSKIMEERESAPMESYLGRSRESKEESVSEI